MRITINKEYISQKNTSGTGNACKYIIIHETDNTKRGAGAKTHAKAQHDGHFRDISAHYYCGSDGIYQAAEHTYKCWHIGRGYGGNYNVPDATNNNSIGIEICVNRDGNYAVARKNAIKLVKYLIKNTGIPAYRVIRHYDAKGKYCPRKMLDIPSLWRNFKTQISNRLMSGDAKVKAAQIALNTSFGSNLTNDGKWGAKSQTAWNKALQTVLNKLYDAGLVVDGIIGAKTKAAIRNVKYGDNNLLVGVLQIGLYAHGYTTGGIDYIFGQATKAALMVYQDSAGLTKDGIAGKNTFTALSK